MQGKEASYSRTAVGDSLFHVHWLAVFGCIPCSIHGARLQASSGCSQWHLSVGTCCRLDTCSGLCTAVTGAGTKPAAQV